MGTARSGRRRKRRRGLSPEEIRDWVHSVADLEDEDCEEVDRGDTDPVEARKAAAMAALRRRVEALRRQADEENGPRR